MTHGLAPHGEVLRALLRGKFQEVVAQVLPVGVYLSQAVTKRLVQVL